MTAVDSVTDGDSTAIIGQLPTTAPGRTVEMVSTEDHPTGKPQRSSSDEEEKGASSADGNNRERRPSRDDHKPDKAPSARVGENKEQADTNRFATNSKSTADIDTYTRTSDKEASVSDMFDIGRKTVASQNTVHATDDHTLIGKSEKVNLAEGRATGDGESSGNIAARLPETFISDAFNILGVSNDSVKAALSTGAKKMTELATSSEKRPARWWARNASSNRERSKGTHNAVGAH